MIIKFKAQLQLAKRELNDIFNELKETQLDPKNKYDLFRIENLNLAIHSSEESSFDLIIGDVKGRRIEIDLDQYTGSMSVVADADNKIIYNIFTKNDICLISIYDQLHKILYLYRYDSITKDCKEISSIEEELTVDDLSIDHYIEIGRNNILRSIIVSKPIMYHYNIIPIKGSISSNIFIHEKDNRLIYDGFNHTPSDTVKETLEEILKDL